MSFTVGRSSEDLDDPLGPSSWSHKIRKGQQQTQKSEHLKHEYLHIYDEIHSLNVELATICEKAKSYMFQRFSSHVGRYRIAEICSQGFLCFDDFLNFVLLVVGKSIDINKEAVNNNIKKFIDLLESLAMDCNFKTEEFNSVIAMARSKVEAVLSDEEIHIQSITELYGTVVKTLFYMILDTMGSVANYQIGEYRINDLNDFLSSHSGFPSLSIPVIKRPISQCNAVEPKTPLRELIMQDDFLADAAGLPSHWNIESVLEALSPQMTSLAYYLIAILPRHAVGKQKLSGDYKKQFGTGASSGSEVEHPMLACNATGLAFSHAECLSNRGWGTMTFTMNNDYPYDATLSVTEMSQGGKRITETFVQPVVGGSQDISDLLSYTDQVYKTLHSPTPDLLYVNPMVSNCQMFSSFGASKRKQYQRVTKTPLMAARIVIIPINPLIPPPWRLVPDYTKWHESKQQDGGITNLEKWEWWFSQCSLQSTMDILLPQGYELLQVEQSYAWFVRKGFTVDFMGRPENAEEAWLQGWYCLPTVRTFDILSIAADVPLEKLIANESTDSSLLCEFIRKHNLPVATSDCGKNRSFLRPFEYQNLKHETGKSYMLESRGRGRCFSGLGFCECFPPYKGRWCEDSVEPRVGTSSAQPRPNEKRPFRVALHFLIGEIPELLKDLETTLPLLWERYNRQHDYPVIIFHDGLKDESRRRLVEASKNHVWFAFIEDFTLVPSSLRIDADFGGMSWGYRAMCRFRAGPIFLHPVFRDFDYAFTLDSDGHFPTDVISDPVEQLHRGGYKYAYSHISRDQPKVVQHFWEFTRLFMRVKGIEPESTILLRRLTDALVLRDTFWHEWNRLLFMNDIEIVDLKWFQRDQYQEYFRFLDSMGGFWRHRWGDHAVRTLAVAMFLPLERIMKMQVPYGHQSTCRCGTEHPDKVCSLDLGTGLWSCVVGSKQEGENNEEETVDEFLFFGKEGMEAMERR